jgi:hypothetical protein
MDFDIQNIFVFLPSLMLGIALSAASGFRVFIPLLVANLAGKYGLFALAENMQWLAETPVTIALAVAAVFELAAYYVPVLDNLLDSIATPAAVVAGTLITSSFVQIDDPVLQWGLGLVAGGGVAGTIQAGTSFLRLGSTKFTGGLGNSFLSSFENTMSVIVSLLGVWLPIFIGFLALYFVIWVWRKLWARRTTAV